MSIENGKPIDEHAYFAVVTADLRRRLEELLIAAHGVAFGHLSAEEGFARAKDRYVEGIVCVRTLEVQRERERQPPPVEAGSAVH